MYANEQLDAEDTGVVRKDSSKSSLKPLRVTSSEESKNYAPCLQLKFDHKTSSHINLDDDSSLSSLEDFDALGARVKTKTDSNLISEGDETLQFPKFVPLKAPFPLMVPRIDANQVDYDEWRDTQDSYERSQLKTTSTSKSETALGKINKLLQNMQIRPRLRKKKNSNKKRCESATNRPTVAQPPRNSKRFTEELNLKFVESCTKSTVFAAILYIQLPPDPNLNLCQVKTEIAVSSLTNYFNPYDHIQCLWVNKLQDYIQHLIINKGARPKFRRIVYLRKFDAMLLLSRNAASLIRHTDCSFLHSLALTLETTLKRILLLVCDFT